ncbi:MAG: WPE palindromic element domain-containing protein [Wolbachia sp.]
MKIRVHLKYRFLLKWLNWIPVSSTGMTSFL